MHSELKLLVLAPPELEHRLLTLLAALGESQVSSDWRSAKPSDWHGVFCGQLSAEQDAWLSRAAASHLQVISVLPAHLVKADLESNSTLVLKDHCYYLEVLEVLYRLRARLSAPKELLSDMALSEEVVGVSPAICELRRLTRQVADKGVTVLITGPSGAGKELVARSLHKQSRRRDSPFVPINCGAIPRELLESELFGHERGAFTGAISSRAGRFELAEGGTLFLDEIGDMPLDMQVKILRVIQERQFQRVGSDKTRFADVRIVAATHRDLEAMIAAGEFREDLYYRLNVFPLRVPPLVERAEDVPHLVRVLCQQLRADGLGELRLAGSAMASLCEHHWSGNIRELANLLERLTIMYPDKVVGLGDLPDNYRYGEEHWRESTSIRSPLAGEVIEQNVLSASLPAEGLDMKAQMQALERAWIEQALLMHGGVVSKAAQHLGLRRTTLIEKIRKLAIHV
ncbi:sigma-54 dependent transcriptional regulator [Zhongshania sp.]|jgi:sigma-54 specific flagellar transcriptional regulator A|uniref:sigma-54 interaction domain-containing protein n=1 Tax=Zhongshania sp. TaxID=1971902 RepID=UPI002A82D284|nr:sigma-54 dependent transcriptional regulator [Zhongshania sp.]